MLYALLKIPAKLVFPIYCRHLSVNKPSCFNNSGPLLIAANHPNSFLDAIIVATLFEKPVVSLARGDAFVSGFINRLLQSMNMLPVYRISEGSHRLEGNYSTFDRCREIFKNNGIVLIFSEGLCINEWHLRDLKKGTARLALQSWEEGIPLKVLPLGINYQSFTSFGKNIQLNFGDFINSTDIASQQSHGNRLQEFNSLLKNQLSGLVVEADRNDEQKIQEQFYNQPALWKRYLLAIPALAGLLLHIPYFYPIEKIIRKKARGSGHYDSIVVGVLFLLYPFYLLLLPILLYQFTNAWWSWLLIPALPFFAYSYVQLKRQF